MSDAGPVVVAPPPPADEVASIRRGFKILGAIVVFVVVGIGALAVVLLQNPRVQGLVRTMRAGFDAVMAGRNAPGTEALRAAGCATAMVLDIEAARRELVADAEQRARMGAGLGGALVLCGVSGDGLTCERVAEVYGKAVPDGEPFSVMVRARGEKEARCSGRFGRDGSRLGDMPATARDLTP